MSSDQVINTVTASTSSSWWISTVTWLFWRSTQISVVLGSVVATLLYFKQESLLYFPEIGGIPRRPDGNPRKYRSPSEHQVNFEDVKIPCSDGVQIHAWLMLRTQPGQANPLPTFVFFHGNAGNIGLRLPNALQMMQYLNVNVLLVEYRGYGNSDSVSPNESGLKLDAQAALNFVKNHPILDSNKIFLFGRSLGGAVAFSLAEYAQQNQIPVAGVIVENTFTSIPAMVDHLMPFIAPLKGLILKMKWDSEVIVSTLQCPVMYLAGGADQLVPHSHMSTLHRLTQQSKLTKMHVVPNGTHNETWIQGGQDYWMAIRSFLAGAIEANSKFPMAGETISAATTSAASSSDFAAASSSSSIPIMPNRLFGMVKEAVQGDMNKIDSESSKKKL
ncbi:alpha/beta fold family hydrolase [Nitzschia inconspicua]|uniref:Alpha/beta fold family hydrolase n=1 Tax=Nitzschia inconspicua TaxID=303405 RepID=A0A9K3PVR0_9STRA|nr:alpha/beta fold family hydrolase [Nitzschia inconspicua]KAG7361196.1 alpha/beta fold family hydrolase [Nitzschia inconspicua]